MSSNIHVKRLCEFCQKEFVARTTVTRFCSPLCNKRGYKQLKRNEKVASANENTQLQKYTPLAVIQIKDVLTVKETAAFMGCAVETVYQLIRTGRLRAGRLSERGTRIQRRDLQSLLDSNYVPLPVEKKVKAIPKQEPLLRSQAYTILEVQRKYQISSGVLRRKLDKHSIRREAFGSHVLVPKVDIDQLLKDYYSEGRKPKPKTVDLIDRRRYYTIAEAEQIIPLSSSAVFHRIEREGIQKVKHGKYNLLSKAEIDQLAARIRQERGM